MRIGFIGLGNMGGPMALNLMKAGHALVVHDVRPDAAKPHLDGGANWADSPKALARASELILTSLPGPKEVEAVALGPDGLTDGHAETPRRLQGQGCPCPRCAGVRRRVGRPARDAASHGRRR